MLSIIRNIAPALFLMIFSLPATSTYFLFKVRQINIHRSIRELMASEPDESQLILLKIPLSVEAQSEIFERTENNEFKFRGNMFDVVKSERHGDVTWYWCIWDKEETDLEDALQNAQHRASSQDDKNSNDLMSSFLKLLFIDTTEKNPNLTVNELITYNPFYLIRNSNLSITPPSPPPQACHVYIVYNNPSFALSNS